MFGLSISKFGVISVSGPFNGHPTLANNIVAYWKMDFSEELFVDATGNGNDGSASGAIYTASGKINGGTSFDGINDYLLLTDAQMSDDFNDIQASGSISIWFKTSDGYREPIIYLNTDTNNYLYILTGSSNQLAVQNRRFGSVRYTFSDSGPVSTDTWYHLVLTWDADGTKFYVDGVLKFSTATTTSAPIKSQGMDLWIGDSPDTFWDELVGTTDECAVWSRALTDGDVSVGQTAGGEIADLYNSGNGLQY
jgi:hypothetical protein